MFYHGNSFLREEAELCVFGEYEMCESKCFRRKCGQKRCVHVGEFKI
jgi:hypothetical protein